MVVWIFSWWLLLHLPFSVSALSFETCVLSFQPDAATADNHEKHPRAGLGGGLPAQRPGGPAEGGRDPAALHQPLPGRGPVAGASATTAGEEESQTRSLYLCPGFSIWQGESYSERRAAAHQLRASLTSVVPPVQSWRWRGRCFLTRLFLLWFCRMYFTAFFCCELFGLGLTELLAEMGMPALFLTWGFRSPKVSFRVECLCCSSDRGPLAFPAKCRSVVLCWSLAIYEVRSLGCFDADDLIGSHTF